MVQTQAVWQKTKSGGKAGFDKLWGWADKLGAPVNRLSNKLGSEAFWPTTLDKECDKAARILKSFCKDGFYQEEERPTAEGPKQKQRVLKRIPPEVIKDAKGLAIFTTMRTGLWVSGAGGSGVLVGRKEDGTWSSPSGILLHTAGLGFLVGVDIYDCVVVINTQKALDAFSSVRCTLGGEISAVAGPVGVGGVLETEVHKRQAPVFTYLKSRGFYAGVQVDGTIIIERTDENERFYGEQIGVADILKGKVRHEPYETRTLMATIKAAQGDRDVDQSLIPNEPPPGDFEIEHDEKPFGIPDKEDPDPFGVLALENAGLEIREAGTRKRPTSEQFEFKPSPTSPIYTTFRRSMDNRSSIDGRSNSRRSSWRTSTISSMVERSTQTVDMSTQTDFDAPPPIQVPPALPPRTEQNSSPKMAEIPEDKSTDEAKPEVQERKDSAKEDSRPSSARNSQAFDNINLDDDAEDEEEEEEEEEEEPVVQEIHQATAPQVITRARLVTVAKPIPPKLPPRNPFRNRLTVNSDIANESATRDIDAGTSPMVASGPSPPSTPSLKHDGSSTSSKDSISSIEGLEHVSKRLQPKFDSNDEPEEKKEDKDEFHSVPDSPVKNIPGGFN
ncbi:DUF500-domain-containing protein [Lindgomyces ingoldianus]|uniref:DUF500-domain-containing protein n=1 Tax=Lindgomyces ingoldianus TaxID=673940 RepID=A0ACB6RCI1_9PLEO|nr:DUF500-domain-containing protein [Lindgomyces ingoldianus]KAF2476032.1 DUF500-domain-containing protein [Lindgomyces ingoldianus]